MGAERARAFTAKKAALDEARARLSALALTPNEAARHGLKINQDGIRRSAFDLLGFPGVDFAALRAIWPELGAVDPTSAAQVEIDAKYAVYLERQAADIAGFRRDEALRLPESLDYRAISGLSAELRDKLIAIKPQTLGQAGRIEGITPAALILLAAHAKSQLRRQPARSQAFAE